MSVSPGMRNFLLIWAGQMVSVVGSRLTSFALGIWVLQTTGSTTRFALIFVAMAIPVLLISAIAGALVDRWDRRRTMMACDAVCGARCRRGDVMSWNAEQTKTIRATIGMSWPRRPSG